MSRAPQTMRVSARKRVQIAAQRAVQNVEELGALHNELARRFEEFVDQVADDHGELGRRVTRLQVAEDSLAKTLERVQLDLNARHQAAVALRNRPLWRRVVDWFRSPPLAEQPLQVARLYEAICEQQYHDLVVLPRAAGAIGEGLQSLAEPAATALVARWLHGFHGRSQVIFDEAQGESPEIWEAVECLEARMRQEAPGR